MQWLRIAEDFWKRLLLDSPPYQKASRPWQGLGALTLSKTYTQNRPSRYPCTQGWDWPGRHTPNQTWREDGRTPWGKALCVLTGYFYQVSLSSMDEGSEEHLLLLTYPCPAHSLCNFLAEMVSKDCLCLLQSSFSSSSPFQAIPSKMT